MNQTDKGPEENEEVCSTTEVQHAEKNGLLSWDVTELADGGEWPSLKFMFCDDELFCHFLFFIYRFTEL